MLVNTTLSTGIYGTDWQLSCNHSFLQSNRTSGFWPGTQPSPTKTTLSSFPCSYLGPCDLVIIKGQSRSDVTCRKYLHRMRMCPASALASFLLRKIQTWDRNWTGYLWLNGKLGPLMSMKGSILAQDCPWFTWKKRNFHLVQVFHFGFLSLIAVSNPT